MTKTDILCHDYVGLITFLHRCQLRGLFLSEQEILVMIKNKKMGMIFGNWMAWNPCEYRPHTPAHRTSNSKLFQSYSSWRLTIIYRRINGTDLTKIVMIHKTQLIIDVSVLSEEKSPGTIWK